jgi:hypothetical protein
MGSRMSDSEALVDRCRKVKWSVVRGAKGYKVYDPKGTMHTVHLTYSDIRSLENAERRLDAAGLSDAEKAQAGARITESRTRNDIAREFAEQKAKEMAANASLVRAAGPYMVECEDVPLDWLVGEHPRPWQRWVNITSVQAAAILKDHNAENRPLSPAVRDRYRDIILAGLWQLTHQGLAFDVRGILQDGQHRLAAMVEVEKLTGEVVVVPFSVYVGMPVENFKVIDEGALRIARQLFARGGEKHATVLQSLVRLTYYHLDGDARRSSKLRLPNQVVIDTFGKDQDAYRDSAQFGVTKYPKIRGISCPALGASHYLLRKTNGADNEYVRQFFEGLVTGAIPDTRLFLDDDDPRAVLRKKLGEIKDAVDKGKRSERRSALTQVGMIITSWNNMVIGRKPRTLPFTEETPIPVVLRCIPGDGGVPAQFVSPMAAAQ